MVFRSRIERVVLVVLDGLRADAIGALGLRSWQRLASRGATSLAGTTVGPSVTAAAMASLLTGTLPEIHGLRSDRFHLPKARGPVHPLPRVLGEAGLPTSGFVRELPFLLRGLGARMARHLGIAAPCFAGNSAREIFFAARARLSEQRRGLVILHWPDADQAGHAHGWMSPEYAQAARRMDDCLGQLAEAAEIDRDPGSLLIALADHGGGGVDPRDHESAHPLDRTVPVLLAGTAVAGEELYEPSLLDIPATVLWALGVPLPESYVGRPLCEAFAPARAAALG